MDATTAIDLCRAAILTAVVIGSPMLLVGMAAGLGVGLIQALTQIQDQTVSFVPRVLAMAAVLAACLPWLIMRITDFTRVILENEVIP